MAQKEVTAQFLHQQEERGGQSWDVSEWKSHFMETDVERSIRSEGGGGWPVSRCPAQRQAGACFLKTVGRLRPQRRREDCSTRQRGGHPPLASRPPC